MNELIEYGKKLVKYGLTNSFFGNISVRIDNERMLISKTGSMLDELEKQLIEVGIFKESEKDKFASTELSMHRLIYKKTDSGAVIHAHPPYTIALSLIENRKLIHFIDEEAKHLFPDGIPIVEGKAGTVELGERVSSALKCYPACIIRGHGSVSTGKDLKEAFVRISALEFSSRVKIIAGKHER